MTKGLLMGLLALGLVLGLGATVSVSADAAPPCNQPCNDCSPCPPPPPPPPACGVDEIVVSTDVFVGDCTCCYDIRARLLDDCSPCGAAIDVVEASWCAPDAPPWELEPWFGANQVLGIEDVAIVDGVANVVLRIVANPDVFDGGIFGNLPRAIEVTINGRTNVCCGAFTCDLQAGGPLALDWNWLWGGDAANVKVSVKSSAKASVKADGYKGKYYAKAYAKSSVKIKAGSFKLYAKASAKASVKSGPSGYSAKASAKSSVKIKGGVGTPPPWAMALAAAHAGPGAPFGGAFAKAWAGWLSSAFAYAGPGGFGGAPVAVAIAGGPFWQQNTCRFSVLWLGGCDCGCGDCGDCGGDCGCNDCPPPPCTDCPCNDCPPPPCADCPPPCPDCPCTGPNCPPPGPCGPCDGKVTTLTLRYSGPSGLVTATGKAGSVFSGQVVTGGTFTVTGNDKNGTLGTNLDLTYPGGSTAIHTSCSQPIGVGMVFGPFRILAGASRNGGALCAAAPGDAQQQKGSKKKK